MCQVCKMKQNNLDYSFKHFMQCVSRLYRASFYQKALLQGLLSWICFLTLFITDAYPTVRSTFGLGMILFTGGSSSLYNLLSLQKRRKCCHTPFSETKFLFHINKKEKALNRIGKPSSAKLIRRFLKTCLLPTHSY